MAEKEIAILKMQIELLGADRFDLEAWKNQTVIFLERIFGKESTKVKLIRELHYDYSSWNLRDTSGGGQSKDPVRLQAKAILEAAIEELDKLGLPVEKPDAAQLQILLSDELTGRQMKEIDTILHTELPDRKERISRILETLEKETLAKMIARLLLP
jgi:hypothetical protein